MLSNILRCRVGVATVEKKDKCAVWVWLLWKRKINSTPLESLPVKSKMSSGQSGS